MAQKKTRETAKREKPEQVRERKFKKVLQEIAENGLSARQACKVTGLDRATFYEMLNEEGEKGAERASQYARACEDRQELLLDEILEIADDATRDTITRKTNGGGEYETINKEWVDRSKLRVDVRKWALSKMNPRKFGDKVDLDVTSGGEKIKIELNLGSEEDDADE